MKTLNAKRITAIAAGAALLGAGLAVAGSITFGNLPIITSQGQPQWQIVIGHAAQPSDGVAAGNIAAAIGNLAYTSTPVTASVNATQAASVLGVQVTAASYTLTNQQVWLNESGSTAAAGTYQFGALIGSVLNRALISGSPQNTKALQNANSLYAYTDAGSGYNINNNPPQSPYTAVGGTSLYSTFPTTSTGGGVSFTSFVKSGGTGDNILEITNSQLSGLLNQAGSYLESESIWMTGFPVFSQYNGTQKVVNRLNVLGVDGAYQIQFSKPISRYNPLNSNTVDQASFTMLGQNWTILKYTPPSGTGLGTGNVVFGGKLELAQSLVPLTTVYVGQNLSSGPFTVQLTDLGQPANGVSPASINLYYNGVLQPKNTSQINQGAQKTFNVSGNKLVVSVNQTFAGLYAYQKWAKMQLYSNVYNLTDAQTFNQTNDKNWIVKLGWTNYTGSTGGPLDSLSTIIIYGNAQLQTNLTQGQSFQWISDPAAWKVTYGGDSLGTNYDPVTFTSTNQFVTYNNAGTGVGGTARATYTDKYAGATGWAAGSPSASNQLFVNSTPLTEPAAILQATSTSGAFTGFGSTQEASIMYDLTPYALTVYNSINTSSVTSSTENVFIQLGGANIGNYMQATAATGSAKGLQITIYNASNSSSAYTFNGDNATIPVTATNAKFYDGITGIKPSRPIPGLTVNVNAVINGGVGTTNVLELASLAYVTTPILVLPNPGNTKYNSTYTGTNVQYTQLNSAVNANFTLATAQASNAAVGTPGVASQYFVYNAVEYPVPYSTTYNDLIQFGIVNNTGGLATNPLFILNYTAIAGGTATNHGTFNNITYVSSQGHNVAIVNGFKTEKGSTVTSLSSSTIGVNFAKAVDTMLLTVSAVNANTVGANYKICPGIGSAGIGVGQSLSVCGINNASIYAVTGNVAISGKGNFSITGISSIQATPSLANSDTPVLLKGLSGSAPLVVLDSQANPASNLILIGSHFVNSLSNATEKAYNISITGSSSPVIMQAYGNNRILIAGYTANQTMQAADSFINQLYAGATT